MVHSASLEVLVQASLHPPLLIKRASTLLKKTPQHFAYKVHAARLQQHKMAVTATLNNFPLLLLLQGMSHILFQRSPSWLL